MATKRRKTHDNLDQVLHAKQKQGPLKKSTKSRTASEEPPHSPFDQRVRRERAVRGKTVMEGKPAPGGSSMARRKKQRGRSSKDGLQGT